MSTISNLIFKDKYNYVTSPYGKRRSFGTSAGVTSTFHYGTDYGTNGKKLPQYAIEDGTVLSCGTASDGAKYIWVSYPRTGKKLLHYHLSEICVKKGQSVIKGTLLGKTGKTGKATGVHLHLGVKDLKTEKYEDPEIFSKNYVAPTIFRPGTYKVDAAVLNVRSGAGTTYGVKTFSQFAANARAQIKKLNGGSACNGYVNGVVCTVSKVSNEYWGKTPSGWICLKYCTRI